MWRCVVVASSALAHGTLAINCRRAVGLSRDGNGSSSPPAKRRTDDQLYGPLYYLAGARSPAHQSNERTERSRRALDWRRHNLSRPTIGRRWRTRCAGPASQRAVHQPWLLSCDNSLVCIEHAASCDRIYVEPCRRLVNVSEDYRRFLPFYSCAYQETLNVQ